MRMNFTSIIIHYLVCLVLTSAEEAELLSGVSGSLKLILERGVRSSTKATIEEYQNQSKNYDNMKWNNEGEVYETFETIPCESDFFTICFIFPQKVKQICEQVCQDKCLSYPRNDTGSLGKKRNIVTVEIGLDIMGLGKLLKGGIGGLLGGLTGGGGSGGLVSGLTGGGGAGGLVSGLTGGGGAGGLLGGLTGGGGAGGLLGGLTGGGGAGGLLGGLTGGGGSGGILGGLTGGGGGGGILSGLTGGGGGGGLLGGLTGGGGSGGLLNGLTGGLSGGGSPLYSLGVLTGLLG